MTFYAKYTPEESSVSYGVRMEDAKEQERLIAVRAELTEELRRVHEPVVEARRRLLEAEQNQLPLRDELMLRLYEAKMGPTDIGRIVGVTRQTVHQGIIRARLARALAAAQNTPTTPQP